MLRLVESSVVRQDCTFCNGFEASLTTVFTAGLLRVETGTNPTLHAVSMLACQLSFFFAYLAVYYHLV